MKENGGLPVFYVIEGNPPVSDYKKALVRALALRALQNAVTMVK